MSLSSGLSQNKTNFKIMATVSSWIVLVEELWLNDAAVEDSIISVLFIPISMALLDFLKLNKDLK